MICGMIQSSPFLLEVFSRVLCCCPTFNGGTCCSWESICTGIVSGCMCI